MFWREAPENVEHFCLICKAKSLMFWREAPKKLALSKNYNLGRQDFNNKKLGQKIPEFWVPPIVKGGGYNSSSPVARVPANLCTVLCSVWETGFSSSLSVTAGSSSSSESIPPLPLLGHVIE